MMVQGVSESSLESRDSAPDSFPDLELSSKLHFTLEIHNYSLGQLVATVRTVPISQKPVELWHRVFGPITVCPS